jgi:hypothetical protein
MQTNHLKFISRFTLVEEPGAVERAAHGHPLQCNGYTKELCREHLPFTEAGYSPASGLWTGLIEMDSHQLKLST